MNEYFPSLLIPSELAQLHYIPTIPEFVLWMEQQYGPLTALEDGDTKVTYQELCDAIARRRAFIASLGLDKDAKIGIFDLNSRNAIELFFAITSAGYTAILLPSNLTELSLIGSCHKFDIKALFVRDEFAPMTHSLDFIKVFPASSIADEKAPVATVDKNDPAAIYFTGGTTGSPKGAIIPHRAFMRGAINASYRPTPTLRCDKQIAFVPISHIFGSIDCMMGTFFTGGTLVTVENRKEVIGRIPKIQPTVLVLVPAMCDLLASLAKINGPEFLGGKLRMILCGAANVPTRLIEEFDQYGVMVFTGYGLTETANLTSANVDVKDLPTSVGQLYPEQEAKIVDGELWLKGDNVFLGYYKDPESTAAALTDDGWLRTGDLARFDAGGFLYITGRIKNLILLPNGENISPESIEESFYSDPAVKDVLAREDDINGIPCIAIEILPKPEFLEGKSDRDVQTYMQALTDRINNMLPESHRITKMIIRKEDFKRTGSMKVYRF